MMTLEPKKNGGPNIKFFESPETISLLEGVKTWLQKNYKKVIKLLHLCSVFSSDMFSRSILALANFLSPSTSFDNGRK